MGQAYALHRSKADEGGNYRVFYNEINARLLERRSLETDMRTALEQDQFELVYQPIVSIAKQIVALEALLRWRRPKRGTTPKRLRSRH